MKKVDKTNEAVETKNVEAENEVIEKKSKRIKVSTLIAGILTIIFGLAMVGMAFYVGYVMVSGIWIKDTSSAGEAFAFALIGWIIIPLFLLIAAIILVVAITNLTSGIFAVIAATKEDKKFLDHKGLVITSIVFDFITMIALGIFGLAELGSKKGVDRTFGLILLVAALIALVMAILKIVEIKRVSNRYKAQDAYQNNMVLKMSLQNIRHFLTQAQ